MAENTLQSLHPPVQECVSGVAWAIAAFLLWQYPQWFLWMPESENITAGIVVQRIVPLCFLLVSLWRFWQSGTVIRYRLNLKKLPRYQLAVKDLPNSSTGIFLGKGFCWQPLHTQRLRDIKRAAMNATHKNRQNRNDTGNLMGGSAALHAVGIKGGAVYLPLHERSGHTLVLGTTRVGKTRLLELQILADIRRHDGAVVVIDPKGDPDLLRRLCAEAVRQNRQSDLTVFHLGYPDVSVRYNPIGQFTRITEVANRIANQLPSHGEAASFREFAWRFVNIIASAMDALGQRPTYRALDRYLFQIDGLLMAYCEQHLTEKNPNWKELFEATLSAMTEKSVPSYLKSRSRDSLALIRVIERLEIDDPILNGLVAVFNYDQTYFQKITASVSPLFAKLTSGRIGELISPDYDDQTDTRPLFSWEAAIREKKLVYIGLDALSDATVASAVGNSLFADLCSTIGKIYKFGVEGDSSASKTVKTFLPVHVYADEFNELAGDEFIPLVNKGGGAGLRLTVATQTVADIEARFGSSAKANQVLGNFNSWICLRAVDEATAKRFTDKLPQHVPSRSLIPVSGSSDTGSQPAKYFSTHNEDRIAISEAPLLDSDDIMCLPKGHAFCWLSGGQLWKLRIPLLKDNDSDALAHDVNRLLRQVGANGLCESVNEEHNHE